MNKYQIGDLVIKDGVQAKVINVIHTCLGTVYDTKKLASNDIEVSFEKELRTG